MEMLRGVVASAVLLGLCFSSCAGLPGTGKSAAAADWRAGLTVESASGRRVDLDEVARELARCDVVFLGEEHDDDVGDALQLELTRRILELRPNASLSFEMFERDVQGRLDRYLAGEIGEEEFLAHSRPWPNYRRHYRPLVELARERGLPAIAANIPRPLAARVAREGLAAVEDEEFMPVHVLAPPGEYRRRFATVMGNPGDADEPGLSRWFLAQCVKDEAMAESIELALCAAPPGRIVIHYCGHFHSDFGLGTVERLLRRQPSLEVGVVTMTSRPSRRPALDPELARSADYVWLVPK